LAALGFASAFLFFWAAAAQASPPQPKPKPGQHVVQFVNESNVTLLLAAFGPTAVQPRESSWVLQPNSWLTIDVPTEWQNTRGEGKAGPRFWARTGCRYDQAANIAQCETGDWGGFYDGFKQDTIRPFPAGISPNTFTEWCFNCDNKTPPTHTFWDVSAVDGADLSVNIQPLQPFSNTNPDSPGDIFWCVFPNSVATLDPRSAARCTTDFQLKRSALHQYIIGDEDYPVACFSNCGKYKFPLEPPQNCTDGTDARCSAWKRYCCTAGPAEYNKDCLTDADCEFGNACFAFEIDGQPVQKCTCRGWVITQPCPESVCTNQGAAGGIPPYGTCSQAAGPLQCIGDDTLHTTLPRAFTWPNDPQTYNCDATAFRVTFAPGGTSEKTSNADKIPFCKDLPAAYGYNAALANCSGVKGKVFGGARPSPQAWSCDVKGQVDAVLCRWSGTGESRRRRSP
jgi:hypothetical protein